MATKPPTSSLFGHHTWNQEVQGEDEPSPKKNQKKLVPPRGSETFAQQTFALLAGRGFMGCVRPLDRSYLDPEKYSEVH